MQRKTKQNTIDYSPCLADMHTQCSDRNKNWRCSMLYLRSVSKYNILLTSCSCFQTTRYVTYELSEQLNKFSRLNVPTFFSEASSYAELPILVQHRGNHFLTCNSHFKSIFKWYKHHRSCPRTFPSHIPYMLSMWQCKWSASYRK